MKVQNPRLSELFQTPKRKTYTVAGISAIVVAVFVLFSLKPTFIKISELNKEIKDKQIFLERLDRKLATLNSLINQKQSISQDLPYFEEDFPIQPQDGFIVANLAAIAEKFNLKLLHVEFEHDLDEGMVFDVEGGEDVETFIVKFTIVGDGVDIEQYVGYLEAFPRIFDIQNINYTKSELSRHEGDLDDFDPYQCRIEMYTYYWVGEVFDL